MMATAFALLLAASAPVLPLALKAVAIAPRGDGEGEWRALFFNAEIDPSQSCLVVERTCLRCAPPRIDAVTRVCRLLTAAGVIDLAAPQAGIFLDNGRWEKDVLRFDADVEGRTANDRSFTGTCHWQGGPAADCVEGR